MDSLGKKEIEKMLILTTEKLEICLKINKHQAKTDRLLKEYLLLYRLINEDHQKVPLKGNPMKTENQPAVTLFSFQTPTSEISPTFHN
jgi:hypothetical protein